MDIGHTVLVDLNLSEIEKNTMGRKSILYLKFNLIFYFLARLLTIYHERSTELNKLINLRRLYYKQTNNTLFHSLKMHYEEMETICLQKMNALVKENNLTIEHMKKYAENPFMHICKFKQFKSQALDSDIETNMILLERIINLL